MCEPEHPNDRAHVSFLPPRTRDFTLPNCTHAAPRPHSSLPTGFPPPKFTLPTPGFPAQPPPDLLAHPSEPRPLPSLPARLHPSAPIPRPARWWMPAPAKWYGSLRLAPAATGRQPLASATLAIRPPDCPPGSLLPPPSPCLSHHAAPPSSLADLRPTPQKPSAGTGAARTAVGVAAVRSRPPPRVGV